MNTQITDAAEFPAHRATRFHHGEDPLVDASVARRLELDRAALMEALMEIEQLSDRYSPSSLSLGVIGKKAESALAAARANFPTP